MLSFKNMKSQKKEILLNIQEDSQSLSEMRDNSKEIFLETVSEVFMSQLSELDNKNNNICIDQSFSFSESDDNNN